MRKVSFFLMMVGLSLTIKGILFPIEVISDGAELNKKGTELAQNMGDLEKLEQILKEEEQIAKKYSAVPPDVYYLKTIFSGYAIELGGGIFVAGIILFIRSR